MNKNKLNSYDFKNKIRNKTTILFSLFALLILFTPYYLERYEGIWTWVIFEPFSAFELLLLGNLAGIFVSASLVFLLVITLILALLKINYSSKLIIGLAALINLISLVYFLYYYSSSEIFTIGANTKTLIFGFYFQIIYVISLTVRFLKFKRIKK